MHGVILLRWLSLEAVPLNRSVKECEAEVTIAMILSAVIIHLR